MVHEGCISTKETQRICREINAWSKIVDKKEPSWVRETRPSVSPIHSVRSSWPKRLPCRDRNRWLHFWFLMGGRWSHRRTEKETSYLGALKGNRVSLLFLLLMEALRPLIFPQSSPQEAFGLLCLLETKHTESMSVWIRIVFNTRNKIPSDDSFLTSQSSYKSLIYVV